jgi:hypothetical protein
VERTSPPCSVGPTFYRVSYQAVYANYTRLVETFGWNPTICKALTIRERRYWIQYLDYKQRLEQFNKMMAPTQQR